MTDKTEIRNDHDNANKGNRQLNTRTMQELRNSMRRLLELAETEPIKFEQLVCDEDTEVESVLIEDMQRVKRLINA